MRGVLWRTRARCWWGGVVARRGGRGRRVICGGGVIVGSAVVVGRVTERYLGREISTPGFVGGGEMLRMGEGRRLLLRLLLGRFVRRGVLVRGWRGVGVLVALEVLVLVVIEWAVGGWGACSSLLDLGCELVEGELSVEDWPLKVGPAPAQQLERGDSPARTEVSREEPRDGGELTNHGISSCLEANGQFWGPPCSQQGIASMCDN